MTADVVLVSVDEGTAVVTINRPDQRNALDAAVRTALRSALHDLADDDAVTAVVITGAGEKAFVAGADIRQLRTATPADGLVGELQAVLETIASFPKPTVACVGGWALGGGCELAMACDIRVAATTARFGLPETGLGIIPAAGGTQRLVRLVGSGRALEMILTGRILTAAEALGYGLVTDMVEPEDALRRAVEVARSAASRAPMATRLARIAVRAAADTDLHTGLTVERLAQAILHASADKQEGIDAFLSRRTPTFKGS